MTTSKTKVCSICAEEINATAKLCPHCQHWQRVWSIRNPAVQGLCLGTTVALFVTWFTILVCRLTNPGEDFAKHRDDLSVSHSDMVLQSNPSNSFIYVFGTLTNAGSFTWKNVEIETRFFDSSGRLIDACTAIANSTFLPAGENMFRVRIRPAGDLSNYATQAARVGAAWEGNHRW